MIYRWFYKSTGTNASGELVEAKESEFYEDYETVCKFSSFYCRKGTGIIYCLGSYDPRTNCLFILEEARPGGAMPQRCSNLMERAGAYIKRVYEKEETPKIVHVAPCDLEEVRAWIYSNDRIFDDCWMSEVDARGLAYRKEHEKARCAVRRAKRE